MANIQEDWGQTPPAFPREGENSAAPRSGRRAANSPLPGGGIGGVSEATLRGMARYGRPYTPSASVTQAQDYLKRVMNSTPGAYQSKYSGQIASLYEEIMAQPRFTYQASQDPLYQQYRQQYLANGQRAMQDAMGNAAALTGGYGNSWATAAGFQAYQNYLQQLNEKLPELESRAYSRYQDRANGLLQRLDASTALDAVDYSRYRDAMADWQDSADRAASAYNAASAADMTLWKNMQDYYRALASMEADSYRSDQDEAYRRDSLAQQQSQWEAEHALNQDKFDFQVRQYEDTLARAQGSGARRAAQSAASAETLVAPALLPTGAGPMAAAAPAIPQSQWESMQQTMAALYQDALNRQAARSAPLPQANASGLLGSSLNTAALNAAKNKVVKNAVARNETLAAR